jgi:hemolysin-activating ACP:hemolysin acyltransferase
MSDASPTPKELGEQLLKSLDKTHLNAAASKLFAASIGDMVVVFSRSPAHKHYSLADIEWMVMPPVIAGQFYIVEAMDKEHGFRAPVAAVTWAFVTEEVDQLLQRQAVPLRRMRPDQWNCGAIGWLIDAAGEVEGLRNALQWLATGPFRERPLKMAVRGEGAGTTVTTLEALLGERIDTGSVPSC